MNSNANHYLKDELYAQISKDSSLFDFVQRGSLDGLWYWDLENPDNEWMSTRFWEVLGYDPDTKKHSPAEWQDLINQDDLQVALDNFNKHCADPNHPYDQIVRYEHKDGSTVWVRCRGVAIRDADGKPTRMLGAHTDITLVKEAELALLKKTEELEKANQKLSEALEQVKTLKGFLPICASCKKIRDDDGYWNQLETYISKHSDAEFTHGICPECTSSLYPEISLEEDSSD